MLDYEKKAGYPSYTLTTPADALTQGTHYLVIGRPITGADDPAGALEAIAAEISAQGGA